ncbi:hypothetical protein [Thorsellia anophelis]|uniref:Uncharacterized protein n=1 Tax=Thorsellia anophelis DSM 18579 TaxID=1123402 RepID=A0A1I0FPB1_9GAMM|nr:hypothetical protein [Thorsellia anophelis]SET60002.1 hypothetical protein SAMN02583745_02835 [Thorsellia anophelis DSM 18579]
MIKSQNQPLKITYTSTMLTIENTLDKELSVDIVGNNEDLFELVPSVDSFVELASKGVIPPKYKDSFQISNSDEFDELGDYFISVAYSVGSLKYHTKISIPPFER